MKRLLILLAVASCRPPSEDPSGIAARHSGGTWRVLTLVDARVERFLERRPGGIDAFVDDLVSLKGKWRALFWSEADFREHVRRRFESRLFAPEDVDREILEPVRRDLAFVLDAAEAGLALDIAHGSGSGCGASGRPWRAPDSGPARGPSGIRSKEPWVNLRDRISTSTARLVAQDLNMNLVAILGSEYAATITTSALAQAGIFGSSVAAGASQSWWNFGVGLVAGVVAGLVVDGILGDVCEDTLRSTVRAELDRFRAKLLFEADGLVAAVRRLLEAHGRALVQAAEGVSHEDRG